MNFTSRQLKAFTAVARLGSFTRAAEDVALTQSGLSLMLKELEAQLGTRLFDRTTRSVRITPAGARFLPVAQRTLAELESVVRDIGDMSDVENRRATVVVTPAMAAGILPTVLKTIADAYPHIEIHMKEADSSQIIPLIDAGEADLGMDALIKGSPGITREVVGTFDMVYICQDEFREIRSGETAFSDEMDWSEVPAAPLIGMSASNPMQQIIDQKLLDMGRAVVQRENFSHLLTIVALVEAGHGSAILPAFILPMCARFSVRATHLTRPGDSIDVHVARKSGRVDSEICDVFVEAVTLKLRSLVDVAR